MRPIRHYVFLFVEDEFLSNILNAAILGLDPNERWPAHVTLAGPYESRRSVPRSLEFSRRVSVLGVDQFRSETQNTVHFRVGAPGMREVWKKPDYPFNPHLTIYDGTDHDLGDELYARLSELKPIFKFDVTRLNVVTSAPQRDFSLMAGLDFSFSPLLKSIKPDDLRFISSDERIAIAVESVKCAVAYCAQFR